jgi:hypothetical protein
MKTRNATEILPKKSERNKTLPGSRFGKAVTTN